MAAGNNCVVLLIDESAAMSAVMRDKLADGTESTKTNAERVATSVNNLLRQLIDGPACDVAVVGYRIDNDEHADVGCRWPASLAGREFVSSGELGTAARVETRTKRVPQADGSITEEKVQFSVWYDPVLGSKGPQIAAFKFCRDLVDRHAAAGGGAGSHRPRVRWIIRRREPSEGRRRSAPVSRGSSHRSVSPGIFVCSGHNGFPVKAGLSRLAAGP